MRTFGRVAGRNSRRRVWRQAKRTWKKVKKLLGKAKPQKRAAHRQELLALFTGVCGGEGILIYVEEVPSHRDLDRGYPCRNPLERLGDWMRQEVSRGFCHGSVQELHQAGQAFLARINRDPVALVDRLGPTFELDPEFEEKPRVPT